ncbi:hypothetical protein HNP46_003825 [Pseudomonas nitritireducens]|uniref:Uncharacterized protein n=1 Tax=Pseudomonas nitroreducens TaxID=46680 RepID=A0A7W7P2P1_PSENT|nr:hypothetical protein [Pseudomonas nitritireducens]
MASTDNSLSLRSGARSQGWGEGFSPSIEVVGSTLSLALSLKGEGTVRSRQMYQELAGRKAGTDSSLSLWERAGVREMAVHRDCR